MRILAVTIFAVMIFVACQAPAPEDSLKVSIKTMEQKARQHAIMDTTLARDLTAAYIEYANLHPEDSLTPYYISNAADLYKEMEGLGLKAVNVYNRVITEYPDHPLTPRSVFMIGYVFDEVYNDKERAAKSYAYFLETYPDHPLAEDAKNLLTLARDTLSDEQMVEQWIKENESNPKNQE